MPAWRTRSVRGGSPPTAILLGGSYGPTAFVADARGLCRDPTTTNLRPSEQRLIALTRQLRFGALPSIPVRKGDLMLEATARRQRRVRLGQPESAASSEAADFKLKRHHLDLIERVRQIDWGTVTIEVQDGLPVHLVIEEEVGT